MRTRLTHYWQVHASTGLARSSRGPSRSYGPFGFCLDKSCVTSYPVRHEDMQKVLETLGRVSVSSLVWKNRRSLSSLQKCGPNRESTQKRSEKQTSTARIYEAIQKKSQEGNRCPTNSVQRRKRTVGIVATDKQTQGENCAVSERVYGELHSACYLSHVGYPNLFQSFQRQLSICGPNRLKPSVLGWQHGNLFLPSEYDKKRRQYVGASKDCTVVADERLRKHFRKGYGQGSRVKDYSVFWPGQEKGLGIASRAQAPVVDKADAAKCPGQECLLGSGGVEPESVARLHIHTLHGVNRGVKWIFTERRRADSSVA